MKRIWRFVREHARKLIPNRAARWGLIYLPLFAGAVWFGIGMVLPGAGESATDIKAALVNAGVYSVRVMAALCLVHAVTHPKVWRWDLDNDYRTRLQHILDGSAQGDAIGAFLVLAGEMVAKLLLLWLILKALVLWPQGVA